MSDDWQHVGHDWRDDVASWPEARLKTHRLIAARYREAGWNPDAAQYLAWEALTDTRRKGEADGADD